MKFKPLKFKAIKPKRKKFVRKEHRWRYVIMKARKILAVSLTAAMTLALAACGGSSSDKESSSKDSSDNW